MKVTHDPLTPEQQKLLDTGEPVALHSMSNVAPGTIGGDAHRLVKLGLWERIAVHHHGDGNMTTTYGPRMTVEAYYADLSTQQANAAHSSPPATHQP